MQRYFIIGTDTNCGKTYVTAQLIQSLPQTLAIKPIASGTERINQQIQNADTMALKENSPLTYEQITPWCFHLPIAPHLAAQQEGRKIIMQDIADYCLTLSIPGTKNLLIEGAGGLMVPLNEKESWIDFLKQTKIPVILVVGIKLGCINHALLTQAALMTYKLHCTGWIANCIDPNMLMPQGNIATLKQRLSYPLLARLPFLGGIYDEGLSSVFEVGP